MKFFDSNIYIGRKAGGNYKPASTSKDLVHMMDNTGIEKALVWHIAQLDYSPVEGNLLINSKVLDNDRLYGCWSILPPQTKELPELNEFFSSMKKNRIFALRAFPAKFRFLLNQTVFGNFADEIVQRKIPLLLAISPENCVGWQELYNLLKEFPELTCIICNTGTWGCDRYLRPLLEKYKNVYVESSFLSYVEGVIEDLVNCYGSGRIVFGSGFPERFPECAMLQLLHSDIESYQKEDIAYVNMEKLMAGVLL